MILLQQITNIVNIKIYHLILFTLENICKVNLERLELKTEHLIAQTIPVNSSQRVPCVMNAFGPTI